MVKILPCGRKQTPDHSQASPSAESWKKKLGEFLKKRGLRATRPREQVALIALSRNTHFDIQTLVKEVHSRYPEISPATVYRSVSTLCEAGLLTETLQGNGGIALYEAALEEHHDHLVCLDCNEIFEFHDSSLEKAQNQVMKKMRFQQVQHKHVIYAHCLDLKKPN